MAERFGIALRDLLQARGGDYVTASGAVNWRRFADDLPTVSYESLRKAVTQEREPGMKIMLEVAEVLGVDAEETFIEVRRERLVERFFEMDADGVEALERWLNRRG